MKSRERGFEQLLQVAELLRASALSDLAGLRRQEALLRRQITALDARPPAETRLQPGALDAALLRYRHWAAPRQMDLNEALARNLAQQDAASAKARLATARATVLARLAR